MGRIPPRWWSSHLHHPTGQLRETVHPQTGVKNKYRNYKCTISSVGVYPLRLAHYTVPRHFTVPQALNYFWWIKAGSHELVSYFTVPDMLVNTRWFDGSSSLLEAHRRVRVVAGPNTIWVPTYEPVAFPERDYIHRLLQVLHRNRLCCFLTGTFTMFTAGLIHSYPSASIFVALTYAPLLDFLFRRMTNPPNEFSLSGFKFVFVEAVDNLDINFFTVSHGENFSMLISFFGIDTPVQCGPPSNLNLAHFIWEQSESLSFVKRAILLFPSNCRHPPLMFLKYYRATSDGWADVDELSSMYRALSGGPSTLSQLWTS